MSIVGVGICLKSANALSSRPSKSLPSNTKTPKPNGKDHCKVIQLRSGKEITIPAGQDDEKLASKTKDRFPGVEIQIEEKARKLLQVLQHPLQHLAKNSLYLSSYPRDLHHLFHKG